MVILNSRNLEDVELFECRLKTLDMGQVGCHLGVSGLVDTKELVEYQLRVESDV